MKPVFIIAIVIVAMIGVMVPSVFAESTHVDCDNLIPYALLMGCDLRDKNLQGVKLMQADLSGADLSGADLSGADLSGADLSNAITDGIYFSHMFGEFGSEPGQLYKPGGISVDDERKIYVADFYNNRIQIFNFDGSVNSIIEVDGRPHGVEIKDDKIYVVKWFGGNQDINEYDKNPHIDIFYKNGTKISAIQGPLKPVDIAIDDSGKIYVSDYLTGSIQIYNSSGILENILTIIDSDNSLIINDKCLPNENCSKYAKLAGITLDESKNILVTDFLNHRVLKLNSSGQIILEFKVPYEHGGKFDRPTNIEFNDSTNEVFVTDNSDRLFVFDSSGNFKNLYGESGQNIREFSAPHGIVMDKFGYVYVAEYLNHRIQVFENITPYTLTNFKIQGANLTDANLSNLNFSGMDLSGVVLKGANLTDANLEGVNFSGMDLSGVVLKGANLSSSDLSNLNFSGMDLSGVVLKDALLRNANLKNTNLTDANLEGVNFSGMDLSGVVLKDALLRNANLKNTNLTDANLEGANLRNANLQDTNLTDSVLKNTNLTNANLKGANLTGANLGDAYSWYKMIFDLITGKGICFFCT